MAAGWQQALTLSAARLVRPQPRDLQVGIDALHWLAHGILARAARQAGALRRRWRADVCLGRRRKVPGASRLLARRLLARAERDCFPPGCGACFTPGCWSPAAGCFGAQVRPQCWAWQGLLRGKRCCQQLRSAYGSFGSCRRVHIFADSGARQSLRHCTTLLQCCGPCVRSWGLAAPAHAQVIGRFQPMRRPKGRLKK